MNTIVYAYAAQTTTSKRALDLEQALQENARASFAVLGAATGVSATSAARRLQRLEDAGVIEGYAARLARKHLGLGVTAFVTVTRALQTDEIIDAVEAAVVRFPEVAEVHLMARTAD